MQCYRTDLHIHTCLSPCADLLMSPKRIVERARMQELDIIAICDHNSAENVQATKNAGADSSLTVLAGMEITTSEEIHLLALFDDVQPALKLQALVYDRLAPGENDKTVFGEQLVVNEFDEIETENKRLLIAATSLTIKEAIENIHDLGGLAIPSHIDRPSYSIIEQLGFIPDDLAVDGLEISPHCNRLKAAADYAGIARFSLITCSDAHFLDEIGRTRTLFMLEKPTTEEMSMALSNLKGRSTEMEG